MLQISNTQFTKSSSTLAECPTDGMAEFAFIGRSNVGKSSLINMLTQQKGLAKTSQTPGKTQLINHFLINHQFYIVDLPGYGYARVPQKLLKVFQKMINSYIYEREQMVNLFLLIDIRHAPMEIDLQFIQGLGEHGVPFSIVFTKADKLNSTKIKANIEAYQTELSKTWEELPPIFITSSEEGTGRDELLTYIGDILHSLESQQIASSQSNK